MCTRRKGLALALVVAAALSGGAAFAETSIVNLSHSFPPGPYSAIAVDPSNPYRVAIATEKGEVGFSVDGGLVASEMHAIMHRRYDAMAIRAGSRAGLAKGAPTGNRATRLFLYQLREGLPTPRWAHWMAVGEPVTQISDIALPVARGDLFVAGPHGIVLGQDQGAAWLRVLGGPGPMQRQKDMMGMSVVVNPKDPRHVFAATDRGVYVSYDRGANFRIVRSKVMQDRFISRWYWDKNNPDLLFAVDSYEVLLSDDGGKTFESVFAAGGEIRDVAMSGDTVLISTSEGLYVVGGAGTRHVLKKNDILGAAGRPGGGVIAITKDTIWWITPDDRTIRVGSTSSTDQYMRLVGNEEVAWVLSKHAVLRIGKPVPRRRPAGYKPPRLLLSQAALERAVLKNTELGRPKKTRLYDRWYAKWVPRVVFEAQGSLDNDDKLAFDATFPVRFRHASGDARDETTYSVMAFWDLSRFLPGSNASNPYAFIESNLRENRKAMLAEIRWRYRECAALVSQLQSVPADPMLEIAWRSRLQEYSAYLEFMSGRKLLANSME